MEERYDIRPKNGQWVVVDTKNGNAEVASGFVHRTAALHAAVQMDRGIRPR